MVAAAAGIPLPACKMLMLFFGPWDMIAARVFGSSVLAPHL
jgi:hypothetical protein